jgi:hypothetical protein
MFVVGNRIGNYSLLKFTTESYCTEMSQYKFGSRTGTATHFAAEFGVVPPGGWSLVDNPPATGKGPQACSVPHCGVHEKFTFLPFTAENQPFHATLGS